MMTTIEYEFENAKNPYGRISNTACTSNFTCIFFLQSLVIPVSDAATMMERVLASSSVS